MFLRKLFSMILFCTAVLTSLAPTRLMVSRVGPCEEQQTTLVKITELRIMTKTYDSSLSGVLNITEGIENGWQIQAVMQKCQDIRNTDTCDYFKSYNLVKNGCGEEDDEDVDLYTMVFHYTEPRLTCPLRAGSYRLHEYPVFTEDNYLAVHESRISTSVFGYTFQLHGYSGRKKVPFSSYVLMYLPKSKPTVRIFCVEAYLQLLYIRNHNWIAERDNVNNTTNSQGSTETDKEDIDF